MKKMFSMLAGVLLVLNLLTPACFAENEAAAGDGEDTTGTVAESTVPTGTVQEGGAVRFEFEDLAKADTTRIQKTPTTTNKGAFNTQYASGQALWGATGGTAAIPESFTFNISKAGYYKVRYAVSNTEGDKQWVSPMSLTVNDTFIGNNDSNDTANSKLKEDLSQYGLVERNGTTIENGVIYPWSYLKMGLFDGISVCYLNETDNTLKVDIAKTTSNKNQYIFFADYIEFIPVDTIDVTQVTTGDYMTRLTPTVGLPIVKNQPVSFDFTVPSDGYYAFMARRDPKYDNGTVTVTVTETQDKDKEYIAYLKWENAAWGNYTKIYGRLGRETIALKTGVDYTLTVHSSAGFTAYYFDVFRTDIDVDGKIVIPSQYWTATDQTNDHYLHARDLAGDAETYLSAHYSDYTVIGSPKSDLLTARPNPTAPVSVMLNRDGYVEYVLNIPKDGTYSFDMFARVYGCAESKKEGTATEDFVAAEPVYFSIDGTEKGSAQYNPTSATDKDRVLTFETNLTEGKHTLKIARKKLTDRQQNDLIYIPFITAEPVNSAIMYQNSVASANIISSVQDGTLVARIQNFGDFTAEDDVMAFFAIYDDTKQMVAVASHIGKWSADGYLDLTIDNFATEQGRTYQAKAFLWNDKLQGESVTLASFPLTTE